MAAIDISGVTKTFGTHVAVDDLSLSVADGSIYGFIGPNGSGKTTTLRMIMNILLPDRGEIHVLGRSGSTAARDDVGYLPEERGLYRKMSVGRLLRYYGALKGAKAADIEREIDLLARAARPRQVAPPQDRGAVEGHVAEGAVHRHRHRPARSW